MTDRADDRNEPEWRRLDESVRKLVEQSPDGVLVVDGGGTVRFVNSAACALLAKPRDELLGYDFGYASVSEEPVEITVAPGEKASVAELRAVEIEWEGQSALLINLRDITARQRQRQRISELNSALRAILDIQELIQREKDVHVLLRDACAILSQHHNYHAVAMILRDENGEGAIQWASEALGEGASPSMEPAVRLAELPACCHRALKQPGETIVLRSPGDCPHCEHLTNGARYDRVIRTVASESEIFGFLVLALPRHLSGDSEEEELIRRLADNLAHAIRSRYVEMARDAAEVSWRESESRFRRLFENSTDAIAITDDGGRYVDANPAACRMFGYEAPVLRSRSVADLLTDRGGRSAGRCYADYLALGQRSGTFSFTKSDGSKRVAEYSAFSLSPTRYVSVLRDVTDRRLLEEQLRQAQKMEAVGRLAGGIAHDFNNLLTAIISFGGFVRDMTPHGDPRRDDIGEVLRAADRASSLTHQLLAFSRMQPIAPKKVDLNALLADTHRLLRRTLGEDIELVTLFGENLWPIFIDPGHFDQVVVNLAVNARDAMPEGGKLTIETKNEALSDSDMGACVLLRVSDTGVGMSESVKARIFEPFFTTKETGKGTGLGLSMVYGLVTQAGGSITVESAPERGTTFEIRLPRMEGEGAHESMSSCRASSLSGSETILVVEDEPMVRRPVVRILKRYGYRVFEACEGTEALAIFEREKGGIDLVLCDVVMPQMGGPATVAALVSKRSDLKVLFMTGYTDEAIVRRGALAPGVKPLHKPFTEEGLLTRVRQTLSSGARA